MNYFLFLVLQFTSFKPHPFSDAKSIAHVSRSVATFGSIYNESRNNKTSWRISRICGSHFHYWFFGILNSSLLAAKSRTCERDSCQALAVFRTRFKLSALTADHKSCTVVIEHRGRLLHAPNKTAVMREEVNRRTSSEPNEWWTGKH